MRYLGLLFAVFASGFTYAESPRLTSELVMYIYESKADIRAPEKKLARLISVDYRQARDEFTRHDLMKTIKPALEKRLNDARALTNAKLSLNDRLGEYDFDAQQFPTGLSESTFIPYDNNYAVRFSNIDKVRNIKVAFEQARKLSSVLSDSRKVTVEISLNLDDVKEEELNLRTRKVVYGEITKLSIRSAKSGDLIGEMTL